MPPLNRSAWPRRAEPEDAAGRAAKLWQDALASPLHNPFCACLGVDAISLGAPSLEQDLLDFLEPRHAGDTLLSALLQARRADPAGPFETWLRQASDKLPQPQRECLVADVTEVLQSIIDMSSGSRFACQ